MADKINPLIAKRKTTHEYSSKPVSKTHLNLILEAGRWAPNSWNIQPWKFIVIKDYDTICTINNSCYYGALSKNPPLMIAVVLDKRAKPSRDLHAKFEETFMPFLNHINVGMAALNMVYQATSLGIDSAIKTPTSKAVNRLLKLPVYMECILAVCIGYGSEPIKKRTRKPLKEIVYFEAYGKKR